MSSESPLPQPVKNVVVDTASLPASSSASVWDRISKWVSENKALVYTIAGVAVVVTSAGVVYYLSDSGRTVPAPAPTEKKKSKNQRRKEKKKAEEEKKAKAATVQEEQVPKKAEEASEELPEVDETTVDQLSDETRKAYAAKLKAAGNKAYGSKDYNRAIDLYGKAIICKPDPVFYSNRAACYNVLSEWEKVVEDTSAALAMDSEYVKALNRRAIAYEHLEKYSEALLDFTASCIIDGFSNDVSRNALERLLKKVAERKAKAILEAKGRKLPSPTFVSNYLQSFRPQPLPEGLEESADLSEESGKGQLRKGLVAMTKKTGDGYEEAAGAFEKALELGDLGEYEALALNMRATFTYLEGNAQSALADLNKSIELQPSLVQSYIKRASLHLELGNKDAAADDFELAITHNKDDPDIYYHRAQLHFILGEFAEAAKDYQKSIDLDRTFIFSHIQLGVTQYKMGSVASAMATFRRSVKNFEDVPDVYNYYGELLLDQQNFSEAIEKFDKAVEMEKQSKPMGINVLPLINKALALFQWKHDFQEAENLCQKALIIDPECDIAVGTMAQLLLQQGKVSQALKYFERAAELARTEAEIVNAISYAEATRTQLEVQERYPQLAARLQSMGAGLGGPPGL
ncbi:mitochondrial import receptor subunit tom-70 [Aspergillus udagawae]|uniref:Mitochondrial import receptor subunit tom-70 n=1 Tax=Aspergillus udagawae TaxID=91492 RepID=A0A8H3NMJ2_9EURO|nr:TOM (translocase of outer membrane) complex component [Aspergillus udagawae]GFF32618.1 mitochondrial import receptor subunit tom-70 [Aspergillus udagawae]GFF32940.1 mitochondrial import receptor subunit tom-70 [Aspergillus udagawae]GFF75473.1 mitochondrial import receptor subunit tom-70 [Aspergillus udagawae]GFG01664.1 mitochondrial import receptor subunit tom-70 [Aspergillus udagawae]GFG21580.1 mitochondrial import receptor subunit tom-70 [Aspergillus udagawae]